ncbi:NADH-ubiquinone oxidoreductase, chain 4L [Rubrobacter xylanophilus DSM 9941]|uniref:NADH-ubiquinone oxidoreductase, chain 4L n=1 Tax=Rubrobacter xylanophilus (strain DSM 9941 / JCM 11954 / NBRC 16129 / PRD-1) TaxID=266117 RepID=Q1AV20_RUBXD|nr:Na+/H+ antiporter subunit C [Rubrobacter xylanophilus]ABG04758.1 NADH-ubiquinone oxidoreductase, chain 4L [Rubrobacter xylanophilus DSM 9941]
MILYSALVFATIFASGTFLLLQRDLLRVVVGIVLVSNSAVFFIISAGLTRGAAPVYPLESGPVSDPLVQAMALTALVIGFGVAGLLLAMVYRLYVSHGTVDGEEIAGHEMRQAEALERAERVPEGEEVPAEEQDAEPAREGREAR